MAYSEELAEEIRSRMMKRTDTADAEVLEKKMFGGLSFLVNGHMSAGVMADDFVFRISPESTAEAMERKYTRPMDFTGRPLRGFAYVSADVLEDEQELNSWIDSSVGFALSLKPKKKKVRSAVSKKQKRTTAKRK